MERWGFGEMGYFSPYLPISLSPYLPISLSAFLQYCILDEITEIRGDHDFIRVETHLHVFAALEASLRFERPLGHPKLFGEGGSEGD